MRAQDGDEGNDLGLADFAAWSKSASRTAGTAQFHPTPSSRDDDDFVDSFST